MKEEKEKTQKERIEELSQKIFGKPSKDIKYLLVTNFIHYQLLSEELARTGLYQWLNVFNGDLKLPRDVVDYSEYDIVQVNLATQDLYLVGDIKEQLGKDSKTWVIANNDYTTELWHSAFKSPSTVGREMKKADMLFGTEYYQTTALSEITGRKCFVIPHPCDTKRLKLMGVIPQKDIISTIWRRYDLFTYLPHLVVRNQGLTTQLVGFDKNVDKNSWLITTLFDYVFAGTNFFDFTKQLRESKIVYDPFTFHSFNRAAIECAAFGIPVVGSNRTQSVNICYPFTKVDPFDVSSGRKLIEKLTTDKEFYKKVVDYAKNASEFYNLENSMERYLTAMNETIEDKKTGKHLINRENKKRTDDHSLGIDISLGKNENEKNKGKGKV